MKSTYRWVLAEEDDEKAAALGAQLGLAPLVSRLLVSRGYRDAEAAERFLHPGLRDLHDPYLLLGMERAVARIRQAIEGGERIRVYGDYDADGVTSTALMHRLLHRLGADFDTYIPHRSKEGYGLNLPAIDLAAEAGVKLIVTVDNGISAVEQIAYAATRGIDVVVTDHHEPPAALPTAAVAIVNPKQPGCPYPFKELTGSAVAFKLAHAMLGEPDLAFADVAAIGVVADLMPLTGENRAIVKLGLEEMNARPSPGIKALAQISGAEPGRLTSGRIAFGLAPRLNAGGRLAEADTALRLLITADQSEAELLSAELDMLNQERQQLVEDTLVQADAAWQAIAAAHGGRGPAVIVVAGEGWNAGIAGLVASKLVERYYKPTVVLAADAATGLCKGSARSIEGFDLHAALTACAEELEHFGGHKAAAGMTMRTERVAALGEKLSALAESWLSADDWIPRKKADLVCRASELTLEAAEQLRALEPCGIGNPSPRFVLRGAEVIDAKAMGKESRHLRAVLGQGGRKLEAVYFGRGADCGAMLGCGTANVLGELSVNEWNGSKRVQLMLQDWQSAALPVHDRRHEADWRSALLTLAAAAGSAGLLAVAASEAAVAELREAHGEVAGLTVASYAEAAAAASGADTLRLVLIDLPEAGDGLEGLRGLLTGCVVEEIHLLSAGRASSGSRSRSPQGGRMPSREQFGEVYGLLKRKGSWIETPDGFLRQVAERTGRTLADVVMMQDVFEELGFLRRSRASVEIVAQPPKRQLEESARYRKALLRSEAEALAAMSPAELRNWLRALAEGNDGKRLRSSV
ncbi:single-stranded-DNA-specific exonuclease [Cohnella sp. OV330]|uniref:single-stranded-DNA-specific exonuclease RecJ n=1 Tax=Cohnella sp. OV330 TaxID=1855288 RepID=UPI0008EB7276|nr:single-stranded-DNA-specific exonuclease RecJ [Cohnella sp. OV330]SFB40716.1 single-stranded-DNA-specific exonuclease [Cohnella sp. OV330]